MSKTPRDPENEYMTLRVSPENKPELLEALHIAAALNELEGITSSKPETRMADAFRRVIVEWVLENRFQYARMIHSQHVNSAAAVQQLDALKRDLYRCKKCRHTKASLGGVRAVMIVTRDIIRRDVDAASEAVVAIFPGGTVTAPNFITLCSTCEAEWKALAPTRRAKAVPAMLKAIGQQGIVEAVGAILIPSEA